MRFQNKVALVTAAGSGIGKATAGIFAKEGASLVAVDVNPVALNDLSKNLKAEGFTIITKQVDVLNSSQVKSLIDSVVTEL